jgi:hypothetical protein
MMSTPLMPAGGLLAKGMIRKAIGWPNRNGFYYVLDRGIREFLAERLLLQVDWARVLVSKVDRSHRTATCLDVFRAE